MASGFDVNIGADTREYDSAVRKGMIEPVGDAQKALDDLTAGGESSGAELTRTFERQQRATTELKSDIDRLNDTIRTGYRGATRSATTDVQTFERASTEGFDEIKDSARSNAIEVGASFTGGFDQAVGGLQGFLAEFLAGFGPGGVIAGVGIAALLGIITQKITEGTESAEAQKQAVSDLASEYIEAGGVGRRSFDDVKAAIERMATAKPDEVVLTLQRAWTLAKQSGLDYDEVVQAIASGSPTQLDAARRSLGRIAGQHLENARQAAAEGRGNAQAAAQTIDATGKVDAALKSAADTAREAARAQRLAARAGLSDFALKAGELQQLEGAFDDAAGSIDDFLNKEKDTLNVKKYIASVDDRIDALERLHDAYAKGDLSAEAVKFLEGQGADAAAAALRGYEKATPAQQRRLNAIWTTAGSENATTYEDAIGKKLDGIKFPPPAVEKPVIPEPDTSRIDRYLLNPQRVKVMLEVYDRKGTRVY
jgi:hypothetical protein